LDKHRHLSFIEWVALNKMSHLQVDVCCSAERKAHWFLRLIDSRIDLVSSYDSLPKLCFYDWPLPCLIEPALFSIVLSSEKGQSYACRIRKCHPDQNGFVCNRNNS